MNQYNCKITSSKTIEELKTIINSEFKEENNLFNGKFVGKLNGNEFKGSTNYNVHIDVSGKIYLDENKNSIV